MYACMRRASWLWPACKSWMSFSHHDRHPLRVDGAQVGVLEEVHQVGLARLLQRHERLDLPALLALGRRRVVRLRDLAHLHARRDAGGRRSLAVAANGDAGGGDACDLSDARTRRANGSFRMSRSVDRWYLRISRSATVPGLQPSRHAPGAVSDGRMARCPRRLARGGRVATRT